jgi:hypothetical protein
MMKKSRCGGCKYDIINIKKKIHSVR